MVSKDREEWNTYQFSKVCNVNPSYKLERNKEHSYVEMAAVSESSPHLKYVQRKKYTGQSGSKFKNGDVLFARITPCTQNGKTAHLTDLESEYGFGSTEFIVLSPKEEMLLGKYLYYFVKGNKVRSRAIARMVGTTGRQRVPNEFFKEELEIELPSIQEQQKIVTIFSSIDEAIEKTEAIIEQTEKVKKGLMQQLLTKGIGHTKFKETEIGKIPYEWELVRVSDLTREHKQGYYTKDKYVEDGVYLIRITDLKNPKVDFSVMPKLDMDENIYEQFKVDKGDFLFARSGASIGRYGIVMEGDPKAVFASYLIRFKFDNQYVNNRYFGYFYESDACWKQIKSIIQGSSNPNINANNIKNLKIALPSLSEQKRIADILSSVDEKIYINMSMLQEFQTLKSGLMQSLFTGKVRVKVDEVEVIKV